MIGCGLILSTDDFYEHSYQPLFQLATAFFMGHDEFSRVASCSRIHRRIEQPHHTIARFAAAERP